MFFSDLHSRLPITTEIKLKLAHEKYRDDVAKLREQMKKEHTKILDKYQEKCQQAGLKKFHIILDEGNA